MAIYKFFYRTIQKISILLLIILIRIYQISISDFLGNQCRFYPTCSEYTIQAIKLYGCYKGLWLMTKRLIKCNPHCKGGYDPILNKKRFNE